MKFILAISVGVFIGNWAFVSFIMEGKSCRDGFVQGLGAALMTLLLGSTIRGLGWAFQSW